MNETVSYYYLTAEAEPQPLSRESELLRVALALNRGDSPAELVDVLFESLDHLIPHDRIGLALRDGPEVLVSAHVRSRGPVLWGAGARGTLSESSLGPILRENKIRIIDDLEAYARQHPASRTAPLMVAEGMRSSLTLPLRAGERTLGLLFFSCKTPRAYGREHVDFLRTIAAGMGLALERAELNEALRRTNAELRTLDQLKTNFLSNLSHELRTPLAEIQGFASLLEDAVPPEQREMLARVQEGTARLEDLLEQLFDFTALEAGTFPLARVVVELGALAGEVLADEHAAFEAAGLTLAWEAPAEPCLVSGDAPKLAKVLRILLANARAFTPPPGRVKVSLREEGGRACVRVEDTGRGIPAAQQAHVFEKFFQADSGPARAHGGMGLGLALAKALVAAHGGTIAFSSVPGRGSKFWFCLPTATEAS